LSIGLTHDLSILANRYRRDLARVDAGWEHRGKQENLFPFLKLGPKSSFYAPHEKGRGDNISVIRLSHLNAGYAWRSLPKYNAGLGSSGGGPTSGKHDIDAHDSASIDPRLAIRLTETSYRLLTLNSI
jgi:hypothetical protein